MNKPQRELDLQEILRYLWHHAAVILLCMAVAAAALAGLTVLQNRKVPPFRATALLVFESGSAGDAADRLGYYNNYASTANVIVQSDAVLSAAAGQLSVPVSEIEGRASVAAVSNSAFLQLTVTGTDEEATDRLCEAILAAVPDASAGMTSLGTLQAASGVTVSAVPGSSPLKPALIGALIGAIAAIAVLVGLELLDGTLHDVGDITGLLGLRVLGVIPADGSKAAARQPEAWRAVRAALPALPAHALVLAAGAGDAPVLPEAEQLARTLAGTGRKVLLLDADSRSAGTAPGLCELLQQPGQMDSLPVTGPEEGVARLAFGAGTVPLADLLDAPGAQQVLTALCGRYDCVVAAVPAAAGRAEAAALSRMASGTVLLVRAGRTQAGTACLARDTLSGAPLWGAVLTGYACEKAVRHDGYYYALTAPAR